MSITKNNIVFFTPILDVSGPRTIRLKAFAKHLDKTKFNVYILSFDIGNRTTEIPNVNIIRLKIPNYIKSVYLDALFPINNLIYEYIIKFLRYFINKLFNIDFWSLTHKIICSYINKNFDDSTLYVISVAPFSSYELCLKLPENKVLLDIGDPLYHNSAKGYVPNHTFYSIEKNALKRALCSIVTNKKTAKLFNIEFDEPSIEVLPQGYDEEVLKPTHILQKTGIIRIVYAGKLYNGLRSIDFMVEAMRVFPNHLQLDIYGSNKQYSYCNINSFDRLSMNDLNVEYNLASFLLFIDNEKGVQTPGKIYELLAMRKPILFLYSFESETYELFREFKQITFVRNNVDSIKKFLREIKKHLNPEFTEFSQFEWCQRTKVLETILLRYAESR